MPRLFETTLAIVLTLWGIITMPPQIYNWTHSLWLTALLCLGILGAPMVVAIRYFFPSDDHFRLNYRRRLRSVLLDRQSTITIAADYSAIVEKRSVILWLDAPTESDFVDVISSLPGHQPDVRNWSSDDALAEHVQRKDHSTVLVTWKPKVGVVEKLVPYEHHVRQVSPMPYGPATFYTSTHFDRIVRRSDMTIACPRPLKDAVAFMLPWGQSKVTEERLRRYYVEHLRNCTQPVVLPSRRSIQWTLAEPKFGRVYVLFAIYEVQSWSEHASR